MDLDGIMQDKTVNLPFLPQLPNGRPIHNGRRYSNLARCAFLVLIPAGIAGCATSQLTQSGALKSYSNLRSSNGVLTQTRQRVDRETLLAALTVQIEPTRVTASVYKSGLSQKQLGLVANAMDRSLCAGLSKRFTIVGTEQTAELRVMVVITHVTATNVVSATASKAVNIGGTVAGVATGIPVPTPRLPFGLGSLSVEGVALTPSSEQAAVMTWARGADVMTINARISEDGDAYALAKEFAADFSKLLVTGSDPMRASLPELPSMQGISEFFGGKPKHSACAQFGRRNGVGNAVGRVIGLPPSWTDAGGKQKL